MEYIGYIFGKNIQLPNYLGMMVEGEDLTETITFKMKRDEILDSLDYYLTYKNSEGSGDTLALTKELAGDILISFVVTDAMTAVKGKMEIQVTGFTSGEVPGTDDPVWKSFVSTITIARALHPEEVQPEVPTIFVQYLAQMQAEKLAAEGYAKGTQGGVPVTSESLYYHDNSKYWKDKAKEEADYAETEAGYANTSRNEALSFARKSEGFALGEQDGVPVGPGSPYYENNAEYFASYAADQASDAHDFAVDADNARIASVSETISPDDGGTNTITITYKDGTVKTFTVTNGHTGESFYVYKTYSSISAMNADISNVPKGKFVVIASNVTDPDNAKLYYRRDNDFQFITDMSGATGAGVPASGTTGQVLKKKSNTDYDIEWANEQDISGKANKSEMSVSTSGDKTTITLKSGTSAQVLNAHQDVSGKANKSEMGVSTSGDKTTITLKTGTSAEVINQHQDISGLVPKTDIVDNLTSSATNKPLSANQGKVLNGKIVNIEDVLMGEHEVTVNYPEDTTYSAIMPDRVPLRSCKYAEVQTIKGKTRAWNQLVQAKSETNFFTKVSDTEISVNYSLSGTSYGQGTEHFSTISGHKYLVYITGSSGLNLRTSQEGIVPYMASVSDGYSGIVNGDGTNNSFLSLINTSSSGSGTVRMLVRDLTLIFGAGNEPSTVAEALQRLPDLGKYDAYNTGSLVSTEVSAVESVEINIWDEEIESGDIIIGTGLPVPNPSCIRTKNFIEIINSTSYYYKAPNDGVHLFFYDANQGFIEHRLQSSNNSFTSPSYARYMKFVPYTDYGTTYNHDIQICLNSYADKTIYHPYKTDTLSLPQTVTLKSAGSVSDELDVESGVITRKVGVVDLGTLTWILGGGSSQKLQYASISPAPVDGWDFGTDTPNNNSVCSKLVYYNAGGADSLQSGKFYTTEGGYIYTRDDSFTGTAEEFKVSMSGVYLAYELATPTTESIDPVPYNFLEVEGGGTINTVQEQSPVIDNCLDVNYDIIP